MSWPPTSGGYDLSNTVVVSPDLGNAKEAAAFARLLGTPVAAGAKQRFSDDRVKISAVIGDVADRDVIVLDDEIAKGSTVIELMEHLRERKVRSIRLACTHGLFSGGRVGAAQRPGRRPGDRLHQHGADPGREAGPEAAASCRWPLPWPRRCAASTTANRSAPSSPDPLSPLTPRDLAVSPG